MQKQNGLIAEIKNILNKALVFKAFAEEENNTVNYEQLIANARKEEKDKLYPQITKLKEEKDSLTSRLNEQLLANADLKAKYDKVSNSNVNVDEINKELTSAKAKLEALMEENTRLKEQVEKSPKEEDIRASIAKEYEVKDYLREQLEANKKYIISTFATNIKGSTKEEVDLAIKLAKEQSTEVRKELGIAEPTEDNSSDNKKAKGVQQRQPKPKNSVPPSGSSVETIDIDYVRGLDPRSPEYAEFRKKLGLR